MSARIVDDIHDDATAFVELFIVDDAAAFVELIVFDVAVHAVNAFVVFVGVVHSVRYAAVKLEQFDAAVFVVVIIGHVD